MSWTGFMKAVNRAGTQVMIKTGHVEQTVDAEYDLEEKRFKAMETIGVTLHKELKHYLDSLRLLTNSQRLIAETIDSFYDAPDANSRDGISKRYLEVTQELNQNVLQELEGPYKETVLNPVARFNTYFTEIDEAIKKRAHKKLDYDHLRAKVKKLAEKPLEDATKLPMLERDLAALRQIYENLNSQLKTELPQLVSLRIPYLDPSFESFVKIQLRFFNECYESLNKLQNSMDSQLRQDYVNDTLDQSIDNVLHKMRELNITSLGD
ncbi:hypothetical protein BABINDRAFT_162967 [Babjeviella inositovora NRRL Y-12698]|uniref:BAR domain-containing protein n=1 Tax=Babjeviella inositovora NRRL Y-12698 TaxID=984486 RepID=A0A1E3QL35_9ASCO|nr:uncharacterized protein BABINDRAFT_162967 [Babjeviella inositovora NRRL Y-12698]ODQ78328.1 hypothetical protein BABINDRAFT_162967 [Babjeviella inositovora NRRL Y-12698]